MPSKSAITLNGSGYILSNLTIYSSYVQAMLCQEVSQTRLDGVTVTPPASSPRLASSNAGGLVLQQPGVDCHITNCSLIQTQGDSIAVACLVLGQVSSVDSDHETFTITTSNIPIPPGTEVRFVDPESAAIVQGSAGPFVTTVTPVSPPQPPPGQPFELTAADQLPNAVAPNTFMVPGDPQKRGSGLLIANNRIVQNRFARGMTLFGLINVTVQGNYLHEVCMAGIDVLQHLAPSSWQNGPSERFLIQRNVIQVANCQLAAISSEQLGALQIHSLKYDGTTVSSMPNVGMKVTGNFVAVTPRTGIWYENVDSGSIADNILQETSQHPAEGTPSIFNTPQYQRCYYTKAQNILSTNVSAPPVVSQDVPLLALHQLGASVGDPVRPGALVVAALLNPPSAPADAVTIVDSTGVQFNVSPEQSSWPARFALPAAVAAGAAVVTIDAAGAVARGGIYVAADGVSQAAGLRRSPRAARR